MTKRLLVGLAAVALLLSGAAQARAEYIVTDLGVVSPTALNDAGQVAGFTELTGPTGAQQAFLYSGGQLTNLSTLAGSPSWGFGINASGQVAITAPLLGVPLPPGTAFGDRAFVYGGGTLTSLGTLGGVSVSANAINDAGQIAGGSTTKAGDGHAFLYDGGKMTDLGTLPGGNSSTATAINNTGQVAGFSTSANNPSSHAFLYSNGQMTDLGTLGGPTSIARAVNSSGQVVGLSQTSSGAYHAFLYSGGKMTDLGITSRYSEATGINNAGQVVGRFVAPNGQDHAFLFIDGKLTDLNSLIPADSRWVLNGASAINNKGQITAFMTNSANATRGFLLTPVEAPEPGSLTLLSLGALGLAGHAWRKRRAGT
jgi:probable HAF family extracellular repeat protein